MLSSTVLKEAQDELRRKENNTRRIARIKEHAKIYDVIKYHGLEVRNGPEYGDDSPCKCPFHGYDNRPSAMVYYHSNTFFCFKCRKSHDLVSLEAHLSNTTYFSALRILEFRYNLPFIEGDKEEVEEVEEVKIEDIVEAIKKNLIRHRGAAPLDTYLKIFKALDMVLYDNHVPNTDTNKLKLVLAKITDRVKELYERRVC